MIINGKDLSFGQSASGLPSVEAGVLSLFQPVTVGIIKATQVKGYTQTLVEEFIETRGVKQPMPRNLVIKKEGERDWQWFVVYFPPEIVLVPDDLFLFNEVQFRVMSTDNWVEYGYSKYECVQDFTKLYNLNPNIL